MECDCLSGDLNMKGSNIKQTLGGLMPCQTISMTGAKQSHPTALCMERACRDPAIKRDIEVQSSLRFSRATGLFLLSLKSQ